MPKEKLEITVPEDDLLEFLARCEGGEPIIPDKYTISEVNKVLGDVTFTVVRLPVKHILNP